MMKTQLRYRGPRSCLQETRWTRIDVLAGAAGLTGRAHTQGIVFHSEPLTLTRRYLAIAILSSIACSADHPPDHAHTRTAMQKIAWRQLRWNDRDFVSLRDGRRVRSILKDSATYARTWREVTGE